MNVKYKHFQNIVAQKGKIEDILVEHAEKAISLSDKIEHWVSVREKSTDDIEIKRREKIIEYYAIKYMKHMKHTYQPYIRYSL